MSYRRLFSALLSAITLSIGTAALAEIGQSGAFDRFSPNGYALGVNIMIYAMTH